MSLDAQNLLIQDWMTMTAAQTARMIRNRYTVAFTERLLILLIVTDF